MTASTRSGAAAFGSWTKVQTARLPKPSPGRGVARRLRAGVAALVLGLAPAAARAEVRALAIGIDRYQHVQPLRGAVADARDVAGALRRLGLTDVVLLLDGQATLATVEAAWAALLARSDPGDQIFLTYAGHGARMPGRAAERSKGDRSGGFLVLAPFDWQGPGSGERLDDAVLDAWIRDAERKGVRVVAVIDACHSGAALRDVDARSDELTYRFVDAPPDASADALLEASAAALSADADPLEVAPPAAPESPPAVAEPTNLTWLAGGQDGEAVPELRLPDGPGPLRSRGALSWSLARALEGYADVDRDGMVTRGELDDFVEGKVRALAEARQTPALWPQGPRDLALVAVPPPPPATDAATPPVSLAIINDDDRIGPVLAATLQRARLVTDRAQADLVWDARSRQVVSGLGDLAAERIEAGQVQLVVDKAMALRRLALLVAAGQLRMRVLPDDTTHPAGSQVSVRIEDIAQPSLTLFNLASDGTIQFLYPRKGDPARVVPGQPFELGPIDVVAPFGADHIVAVATPAPPRLLLARLQALDQRPAALDAVEPVLALAGQPGVQLGVQGIFTRGR